MVSYLGAGTEWGEVDSTSLVVLPDKHGKALPGGARKLKVAHLSVIAVDGIRLGKGELQDLRRVGDSE